MAAAIEALYDLKLKVNETVALSLDHVDDPTVVHEIDPGSGTLTGTTTPAATKTFSDTLALTAGAATLDLTSLTGPSGVTVDFTGLKVQLVKLSCPSSNTAGITVDRGAANAYNLFGEDNASAEQVEILPGCAIVLFQNDKLEDVDATHSDVQFAGTGTEQINIVLVAG